MRLRRLAAAMASPLPRAPSPAFRMPPLDLWPLLFLACPVFVWLVRRQAELRPAFLARLAASASAISAVCLYWIGIAFLVDAATYLWMMPFMVGALAGGMALYWGLAVRPRRMRRRRRACRVILAAGRRISASRNGCAAISSPAFRGRRRASRRSAWAALAQARCAHRHAGPDPAHLAMGVRCRRSSPMRLIAVARSLSQSSCF